MQNILTLSFNDKQLESTFAEKSYPLRVFQARIAFVIGSMLFLSFGILDRWLVPEPYWQTVWFIRFAGISIPFLIFLSTFTDFFKRGTDWLLSTWGALANISFLVIVPLIPLERITPFYSCIVLTTIASYCLVGNRFIYALVVECSVGIAYNAVFIHLHGFNAPVLLTHDFFLIAANLIGGVAGYLQEYQKRELFLREQELDVERRKHLDRSLKDPLTGLPNRDLLHDRLEQALAKVSRDQSRFAGYYIDLDGFKKINDSSGHAIGDKILQAVAASLTIVVRESDTVARLGGDEFFVLCQNIPTKEEALDQAKRLIQRIEGTFVEGVPAGTLSASVGICLLPFPGASVATAVAAADKAMYQAKNSGRGKYCLARQVQEEATQRQ